LPGDGDRLERVERLLAEVLRRLERLESILSGVDAEEARIATRIAVEFSLPAYAAVKAAARIASALHRLSAEPGGYDDLDTAIIEVLAVEGPQTLRSLERRVRTVRGRASRRIIRERVARLEQLGLVRVERDGRGLRISLAL